MKKWNIIIDIEKCEDCNNCFLACKDEFLDNDWPEYSLPQPRHEQRWIDILRKERGQYPLIDVSYLPKPCMHCNNAPCIKAFGEGVYQRKDGIVIIDPRKSKGKKELIDVCPYGAIWWNEEKQIPQKCTLCAHLLDKGWEKPRCVQACPTGALRIEFVDENEMNNLIEKERLEHLNPEFDTKPSVYYKNIHLFINCFISGSIAINTNGKEECASGAKVLLFNKQGKIKETFTDTFGDFKFDGLKENEHYQLEVALAGFEEQFLEVNLEKTSITLQTIFLKKNS